MRFRVGREMRRVWVFIRVNGFVIVFYLDKWRESSRLGRRACGVF